MPLITIVIKPAAGPETPTREPLNRPTTIPPTIPATNPATGFGNPSRPGMEVEANPTPRQSGNATINTTKLEGKSLRQL